MRRFSSPVLRTESPEKVCPRSAHDTSRQDGARQNAQRCGLCQQSPAKQRPPAQLRQGAKHSRASNDDNRPNSYHRSSQVQTREARRLYARTYHRHRRTVLRLERRPALGPVQLPHRLLPHRDGLHSALLLHRGDQRSAAVRGRRVRLGEMHTGLLSSLHDRLLRRDRVHRLRLGLRDLVDGAHAGSSARLESVSTVGVGRLLRGRPLDHHQGRQALLGRQWGARKPGTAGPSRLLLRVTSIRGL